MEDTLFSFARIGGDLSLAAFAVTSFSRGSCSLASAGTLECLSPGNGTCERSLTYDASRQGPDVWGGPDPSMETTPASYASRQRRFLDIVVPIDH
jgi:hypothetical protein